jgi:hypothetical protein
MLCCDESACRPGGSGTSIDEVLKLNRAMAAISPGNEFAATALASYSPPS